MKHELPPLALLAALTIWAALMLLIFFEARGTENLPPERTHNPYGGSFKSISNEPFWPTI